jgi:hypothetical protein
MVIQASESQGWTYRLINAARESRPDNPQVIEFAQQFHLAPINKSSKELELIIRAGKGFLDVATWRSALGEAEMRVCRVEVPLNNGSMGYGTGFLIGPSTVITNYHVVEPILKKVANARDIILRFDYKRLENGVTLNPGTLYYLDEPDGEDWLIASSPYSQADLANAPSGSLPTEDELDFALLKIKGKPANDRVGKVMEADSPKRDYFEIPDPSIEVNLGDPIFILQHPEGEYLKLAIDTEASLEANSNHTRLRYKTNTLKGSSGSPCFNINWKLVALHHAGDPSYSSFNKAEYNQGVPFEAIQKYLKKKGIVLL